MTWQIDPAHTSITISVKHMMITTVRGMFALVDGEMNVDEQHPADSHVKVRIDAASVNTGNEQRDQHLRSADFLDVEKYPYITFESTSLERIDDDDFKLHGDLTIRDTTRPITLDAEFHGIVPNLQGGRRAAFSAETKIQREEWGLTWNVALEHGAWLVAKDLKVEIDIAAVEPAEEAAEAEHELAGSTSR